jgi:hypothetical protein
MTTSQPEPPTTALPAERRRWRRWRPRGRAAVIGAVLVAVLVVGAVVTALLLPDRGPGRDGLQSEPALTGEVDDLAGLDGPGRRGGGPGRLDFGDRLGDDTLLTGTVVATAEGSLVLAPDSGPQRTVRTDADTRVRGAGNAAPGDLQAGERVVVRLDGAGDAATAVAVLIPPTRVTGTVTAVAGERVTVVGIDGLTVPADVSALSQKPVVGDLVVPTGVAVDATTLRADGIRFLPTG